MNKTSSIVVTIIIVLFLLGLAYIAGRNSVQAPTTSDPVAATVAPDGTELEGPNAPVLGEQTREGDPREQSRGPVTPPPGGEF